MDWLISLFFPGEHASHSVEVASAVIVLSIVAAAGIALGSIKYKGLGLGIAGVLFAGILAGHLGLKINENILFFGREFGLILFVYSIGMQVGPGFFASLKKQGLPLNLCAAGIVGGGAIITVVLIVAGLVPMPVAAGMLSGAVTNTPSLAAAGEALRSLPSDPVLIEATLGQSNPELATTFAQRQSLPEPDQQALMDRARAEMNKSPNLAYAVAYPFGIMGIILTMLALRFGFNIDLKREQDAFRQIDGHEHPALHAVNLEVTNPNLSGRKLGELKVIDELEVTISRVARNGSATMATDEWLLEAGDVVLAVGRPERLEQLQVIVGNPSQVDLRELPSDIVTQTVRVTKTAVLGKTVDQLRTPDQYNARITRIRRAEVELPPSPQVKLQFGDTAVVVGEPHAIDRVAGELGNSLKELNHPHVLPVFIGIFLGVIVGSVPVFFPGLPAAVKLGLAGGPLVVAIVLSRIGRVGPLLWHLPTPANLMIRELGIVMFLACVGVYSGGSFLASLTDGSGLYWMALAAVITALPLLIVGFIARAVLHMNYMTVCGLLAGSMTDPPALAFAGAVAESEAPSVAYATVYPLTMVLRILSAQLIVLVLAG